MDTPDPQMVAAQAAIAPPANVTPLLEMPKLDPPPKPEAQSAYLRALMYGAQMLDAKNSADSFKKFPATAHETDPMMKPFSHGGMAMMALGFGLGDYLRDRLLKHAPQDIKTAGDALQLNANISGLEDTKKANTPHPFVKTLPPPPR